MKTTIELPDALFRAAKAMAAHRGTTLKAIITHALKREVYHSDTDPEVVFDMNEEGVPHLPSRGVRVTSAIVERLQDEEGA